MTKPEFSHDVLVEDITKKPESIKVEMSDDECVAVAERLGIKGLQINLLTSVAKRMDDGCTIRVSGQIKAKVTQSCVVTLKDVTQDIAEDYESFFLDESQVKSFDKAKRGKSETDDGKESEGWIKERRMPDESDEPEVITKGRIDVGELLVQHISLAIDPYPRSTEADKREGDVVYEDPKKNAFSALAEHVTQKKT